MMKERETEKLKLSIINSIIQSIVDTLKGEFDCEIYTEEGNQELVKPYLLVSGIQFTSDLDFGKKYLRESQFCIKYMPATTQKQSECNEIADQLFLCLECISVQENIMRGTNMKYEMTEGGLHFCINYNTFVYRVEETIPMETMKTNVMMKGKVN